MEFGKITKTTAYQQALSNKYDSVSNEYSEFVRLPIVVSLVWKEEQIEIAFFDENRRYLYVRLSRRYSFLNTHAVALLKDFFCENTVLRSFGAANEAIQVFLWYQNLVQ